MSRKPKSRQGEGEPKSGNDSAPIRDRACKAVGVRLLGILLLIALLLGSIVIVGRHARQAIQGTDRYLIPFSEILCNPPPGQERGEFLAEVQYLSASPEQVKLLDAELSPHLMEAFAAHPWVERVENVMVAPPKHIEVRLVYRLPVIAVQNPGGGLWVLDGQGRILPTAAKTDALPILETNLQSKEPAGSVWRDHVIEKAARTSAFLRDHQDLLRLVRLQVTEGILVLRTAAGSRVRWTSLDKAEGEVPDTLKLERLLQYYREHGSLDHPNGPLEHDVRPSVGVLAHPIKP